MRTEPFETPEYRLYTGFGNFGSNQQHAIADFGGARWSEELSAARDFSEGFTYDRDYRNLSIGSLSTLKSKLGATSVLLAYSDAPTVRISSMARIPRGSESKPGLFPRTRIWATKRGEFRVSTPHRSVRALSL